MRVLASHSAKVSDLNVPELASAPPSFVTSRALATMICVHSKPRAVENATTYT